MGNFPIIGDNRKAWDAEDDLVAIKPRLTPDLISRWFTNIVFPLYHRLYGEKFKVRLSTYLSNLSCRPTYP